MMFVSREKRIISTYVERLPNTPSYALSITFTVEQLDEKKSINLNLDGCELWSKYGAPLGDPTGPVSIKIEVHELELF